MKRFWPFGKFAKQTQRSGQHYDFSDLPPHIRHELESMGHKQDVERLRAMRRPMIKYF